MKEGLSQIQAPIAIEMELFEQRFKEYMRSQFFLLDKVTTYIVKRKGKQLRPMFVFMAAKLATNGRVAERTYRGAALIELLHTATLVHDDVVDDANYRRDFFSVNALWKNKIAVLIGDYLLSRGLLLSVDHEDFDLLKIVSNAVKEMSEGELLQIEKSRLLNITESEYFTIIRQKTASLLASCCAVGAASVLPEEPMVIANLRKIGEHIGIAFQIKDDLFDYGEDIIGKPVGIDIKEKKLTLPLIYALNNSDSSTRSYMINIVKRYNTHTQKVKDLIQMVRQKGGMEYSTEKMNSHIQSAFALIDELPDNPYRQHFKNLVQYTIDRTK